MKLLHFFAIIIGIVILSVPVIAAPVNFTSWAAYGDAWKSNNDTYTDVMWNGTSGVHTWISTGNATSVWALVIGGGAGAGGNNTNLGGYAGGGGSGALAENISYAVSGSILVKIGDGGASGGQVADGHSGVQSYFGNIVAPGGGFGAYYSGSTPGRAGGSGGSGGGASSNANGLGGSANNASSNGTTVYGKPGGASGNNGGGGGGGCGSKGNDGGAISPGEGGVGITNYITGTAVTYCTGGRGSNATYPSTRVSGIKYTGEGGNAGPKFLDGGNGGDGVVIINYLTSGGVAPTASFTVSPSSGTAPLTASFTDTSTDSPTSWNWTFSDGSLTNATQQNPIHTFSAAGNYSISLNATNAQGNNISTQKTFVNVSSSDIAPIASFTSNPSSGNAPLNVSFTDTSANSPTSWKWVFDDGSSTNWTNQNPIHQFSTYGTYHVNVTATNSAGNNQSAITTITVFNTTPVASFSGNVTSGLFSLPVLFTDASSGTIVWRNYSWGDGSVSNYSVSINPVHTYSTGGTYSVSLTVANDGGSNTQTRASYITVNNHVISGFSISPTTGVEPVNVKFNLTNMNNNATYVNFSFGDGSVVNNSVITNWNTSHWYTTGGTYNVIETAASQYDNNSTVLQIVINNPAASGFSANVTTGNAPLAVLETVSTINDNSTQWNWSPNGGSNWYNGSTQNFTYTYPSYGTFSVIEVASNSASSSTTTRSNYITVRNATPSASFTGSPLSGTIPLSVTFTDSSTGTGIKYFNWSYGDGAVNNYTVQTNPSHSYAAAGTYTVALTVSNDGGSNTQTRSNYVTATVSAPIPDFSATPTDGNAKMSVQFTDLSSGSPNAWLWNFGDSNTTGNNVQNPVHLFTSYGTYTISLQATNGGGTNTTTKTGYIKVHNTTPVSSFSGSPTSGNAPLNVGFTDVSTGTIFWWNWSYGDGVINNYTVQTNPSHVYNSPGSYTVILTTSNDGGQNSLVRSNYIGVNSAPTPPVASFTGTPTTGTVPLAVQFTDGSTNSPTSWAWNFGDSSSANATLQNPMHVYTSSGTYTVSLVATNTGGSSAPYTLTNYVTVNPAGTAPIASFTLTPSSGNTPLKVFFTDTSINSPTSWIWNFHDGSNENFTQKNPVHTFSLAGTYEVDLIASNAFGSNSSNVTGAVTVTNGIPIVDFVANQTSGTVPLTVGFIDQTTGVSILFWNWTFGDGTTVNYTSDNNPIYTYVSPGTYTVSLSATNSVGTNITTKTGYIIASEIPTPTPTPTPTPNSSADSTTSNFGCGAISYIPMAFTFLGICLVIIGIIGIAIISKNATGSFEDRDETPSDSSFIFMTCVGVIIGGAIFIAIGIIAISPIINATCPQPGSQVSGSSGGSVGKGMMMSQNGGIGGSVSGIVGTWNLNYDKYSGQLTFNADGGGEIAIDGYPSTNLNWVDTGNNVYSASFILGTKTFVYDPDTDTISSPDYPGVTLTRV